MVVHCSCRFACHVFLTNAGPHLTVLSHGLGLKDADHTAHNVSCSTVDKHSSRCLISLPGRQEL
jgi:hypothetical protein